MHAIYSICCITGTFFTWLFVTRYKDFSWFRIIILIFVSTVVISFEGSLIYSIFFANNGGSNENTTILFLTYTLILQNLGLQMSAFLVRLPVNLFDKAIAVFGGYGCFVGVKLFLNRFFVAD